MQLKPLEALVKLNERDNPDAENDCEHWVQLEEEYRRIAAEYDRTFLSLYPFSFQTWLEIHREG